MSKDQVIGISNRLPWRLPADLANFKKLTLGHTLLMGRKTFESIGRPLPGRETIVITHDRAFSCEGVLSANSVDEALQLAEHVEPPEGEIFVAGGAEIYRQTINLVQRMYLTIVHGSFRGDTCFPDFDRKAWRVTFSERRKADEKNPFDLTFQVLGRTG